MVFHSVPRVLNELVFFWTGGFPDEICRPHRTFSCKKNHALPILRCISEHDNDITNLIYIKIKKAFPPCTLYEKEVCYFFHSEIMSHAPTYHFDYFLNFSVIHGLFPDRKHAPFSLQDCATLPLYLSALPDTLCSFLLLLLSALSA